MLPSDSASRVGRNSSLLNVYFVPNLRRQGDLNVQIEYTISGEEQAISLAVKAAFKSAQTGGFQLKDLV